MAEGARVPSAPDYSSAHDDFHDLAHHDAHAENHREADHYPGETAPPAETENLVEFHPASDDDAGPDSSAHDSPSSRHRAQGVQEEKVQASGAVVAGRAHERNVATHQPLSADAHGCPSHDACSDATSDY